MMIFFQSFQTCETPGLEALDFKSPPLVVEILDLMTLLSSVQNQSSTNFLNMKDLGVVTFLTMMILFYRFNS